MAPLSGETSDPARAKNIFKILDIEAETEMARKTDAKTAALIKNGP